jgi:uncharacterized LabA/DUF88 family protein
VSDFAAQMPQIKSLRLIFFQQQMVTECTRESLVLIDGYNLYHSLLEIEKDTGQKVRWLDVRKLSELLLNRLFPPSCPYPTILFFTAYSDHKGEEHVKRQKSYHQCLKKLGVKIVADGAWRSKDVPMAHHFARDFWPLSVYLKNKYRSIQTHVEKGTDVSIAAHLMHLGPRAKWVCLVTGDSDLLPAINLFRKTNPGVKLGLARPYKRDNRQMSIPICTNISPVDCMSCLLPNPARSAKRSAAKPEHW